MIDYDTIFPDNRSEGETTLRQAQFIMLRMLRIIDDICRRHNLTYWFCSGTLLGAVRHKGFIPWDDDLDIAMMRPDFEKFIEIAKKELPHDIFLQTRETEPEYDYLPLPCKIRDTKSMIITPMLKNKKYHQGVFIDIFPFDKFHKKGIKRTFEKGLKKFNNIISRCYDAEMEKGNSSYKRVLSVFRPVFHYIILGYQALIKPIIRKNLLLNNDNCYIGHGFDTPWIKYYLYKDIIPVQEAEFEGYPFFIPRNPDKYLTPIYGPDYMTPPPVEKRYQHHSTIIKPIL